MKKLLVVALLISICTSCSSKKTFISRNEDAPTINDVVRQIQDQYKSALDILKKSRGSTFELVEAELSLKVSRTKIREGSGKVLIFTPKLSTLRSESTTVTYKLSQDKDLAGGGDVKQFINKNELREAIVSAAKTFNSINSELGTLTKDSFTLDISFSIEREKGGAIGFELWGLGGDFSANTNHTVEHGLTLTFKSTQ